MRGHATLARTFLFVLAAVRFGSALECYKCNSEFDPRCGDPFDSYSLGTVNCSYQPHLEHLPAELEAKLCRKTKQIVSGKVRIIRDCGLITDESADDKACMQRSGTAEVRMFYCSCTGDLCNTATKHSLSGFFFITILGALLLLVPRRL